jgi:Ca2+-binding EF-hand superfamily protein
MGRGFSEEEVNELKEQFDLFDMMGDGECSFVVL